jgi:hypothetical protein
MIRELGSEEFDEREKAMARLQEIGAPAIDALTARKDDRDEERATRVRAILKLFEETGATRERRQDALISGRDSLTGWLQSDRVQVVTAYGTYPVEIRNVRAIQFASSDSAPSDWTVKLVDGTTIDERLALEGVALDDVRRIDRGVATTVSGDTRPLTLGDSIALETWAGTLALDLKRVESMERRP